jgi:uncharacterized protein (TIGR03435 family)
MRCRFAVALALTLVAAPHALAQKFEVAAIRPCRPDAGFGGGINPTPGRVTVNCMSLLLLIRQAYVTFANGKLNPPGRAVPIEKAPTCIESAFYTIEAKAQNAPPMGTMMGPMMQALLEDRFRLKIRSETREVPVYALAVAKEGPKLKAAPAGSCATLDYDHLPAPPPPGQRPPPICKFARVTGRGFDVDGVTISEFAEALSSRLDRDVLDRTGITGLFNFEVALYPDAPRSTLPPPGPGAAPPPSAPPPLPDPSDPGANVAAAQAALQKYGLRLESAKGPGRFLVIDSVEWPSEN